MAAWYGICLCLCAVSVCKNGHKFFPCCHPYYDNMTLDPPNKRYSWFIHPFHLDGHGPAAVANDVSRRLRNTWHWMFPSLAPSETQVYCINESSLACWRMTCHVEKNLGFPARSQPTPSWPTACWLPVHVPSQTIQLLGEPWTDRCTSESRQ